MSLVVGQVVRGENFWDRDDELEIIWEVIETGGHILLAAPRRVGKTSIMYKVLDEPKEDYVVLYLDTESAEKESEFWHKLFHKLLKDQDFIATLKTRAHILWKRLTSFRIKKVTESGVEFDDGRVLDYSEAFKELVHSLGEDKKIIIMIDEFAQTIENIIKIEGEESALSLLKAHRELRQDAQFSKKITFVYAGSIGLESVVAKISGTKHINDLNSIKIKPLTEESATAFTMHLCENNGITIKEKEVKYWFKEVEWLIPFYIQLIAQELKIVTRGREVEMDDIKQAIQNALEHRNHFDHWWIKIKNAFETNESQFAKEVLNTISENMTLTSSEIHNLATKYDVEEDHAKETIHSLVYDGYINNNDDVKEYRFNSPILRMWWNKNVAN